MGDSVKGRSFGFCPFLRLEWHSKTLAASVLNFADVRHATNLQTSIVVRMKRTGFNSLIALLLLTSGLFASVLSAGMQGTFRGEVVSAPRGEQSAGLLYLMGHDGNVRRVVVARAAIVYDAHVPSQDRAQSAQRALVPGTEVRVTALVDAKSGEWTASRVEVIAHHSAAFEDDYDEDGAPADEPQRVTTSIEDATALRTI